jgi:DNA-binding PadR family transcriptional regulator
MLARGAKNGAELMDEIEKISWGWRPSPGSIYPLLEELAKEELVRRADGGRYEITERGRESLSAPWEVFGARPTTIEAILAEMASNASYLEDLSRSDASRIQPHAEALRELAERLAKLGKA